MNTIQVVNIKCGGCAKTITSELEKFWATDISINIASQKVSFEGDEKLVSNKLAHLGYPKAGTPEATSLLKKAKSFVSCALGKTK